MQGLHKRLGRVQRGLAACRGDPALAALWGEPLDAAGQQLAEGLASAVAAHQHLRAAFDARIVGDAWGVIQRAFDLICEIWTGRRSTEVSQCCLGSFYSVSRAERGGSRWATVNKMSLLLCLRE